MKNLLNIVLIGLLAFVLLAPDDLSFSLPHAKGGVSAAPMEMYFAFAAANQSDGGGDVVECECGGDGDVGDGRIRVPCPCKADGKECQCSQSEPEPEIPTVDLGLGELKPDWTYVFVITNPSWCAPCRVFDRNVITQLDRSWSKSRQRPPVNGYCHIVLVDENSPIFNALGPLVPKPDGEGEAGFPSMVIVRNNEIKHVAVGLENLPKNKYEFVALYKSIQ